LIIETSSTNSPESISGKSFYKTQTMNSIGIFERNQAEKLETNQSSENIRNEKEPALITVKKSIYHS